MPTSDISKFDDTIDSRDVIARIRELEAELQAAQDELDDAQEPDEGEERDEEDASDIATCGTCGLTWNDTRPSSRTPAPSGRCPFEHIHEEAEELAALKALAEEAEGYASDWRHGATLIRDEYFTTYARQLAEDIGAVSDDAGWPGRHIDWDAAADELRQDYTSVDFDGETFWVR